MARTLPHGQDLVESGPPGTAEGAPRADRGLRLLEQLDQAAKRALDLVLAGLGLLLFSPPLIAIAVAIRLTSPGPALFQQVRVGYRQSAFVMLKFRTMYQDNDDAGHRAPDRPCQP